MKLYSSKISLIKNSRGVYCIDTSIGCGSGMSNTNGGCYGDCYAAKSAKLYGYDFNKTVLRSFESRSHERQVLLQISKVKLDFIRIGCTGDPSENWEHTFNILNVLCKSNKEIVIITRHWDLLRDIQLHKLSKMNICINTSVSALDNELEIQKSLEQFYRIKLFCKSVLRIISCNFNKENPEGLRRSLIQESLFKNENIIDTVFRPSKSNRFVLDGVVNITSGVFNGHKAIISKYNRKTYTGKCGQCKEMCGVNVGKELVYSNKQGIVKQTALF